MKLRRKKSNSSSVDSMAMSSVSGHSSSAEEPAVQDGSHNQGPTKGNCSGSLSSRNLNAAISDSTSWRIQRSWKLLTSRRHRLEKVGVEFFCRMFEHNPELLQLFHFGSHELERDENGNRILPPALKSHALTVMQFLGKFVSGLTCLEQAIPQVRAIGKLHVRAGVEPQHYDILFKHLIETIADELGPLSFDIGTRKAWHLAYRTLTDVMKQPDEILQVEPLEGWGFMNAACCAYISLFGPFQMAGFTARNDLVERIFSALNIFAILCLTADMCSGWIQRMVRVRRYGYRQNHPDQQKRWFQYLPTRWLENHVFFPITFRVKKFLRSLGMERWTSWPKIDAVVILSFPLQNAAKLLPAVSEYCRSTLSTFQDTVAADAPAETISSATTAASAGVHWTFGFGMLRAFALLRVVHFLRCARNNMLLRRQMDENERTGYQFLQLFMVMLAILHITACLWCVIARIELGPETQEPQASPFFPNQDLMFGGTGAINGYLHSINWAMVQLAGIGDSDSEPVSSLETVVIILLHLCGMTLYSIMTGHVISVLEDITSKTQPIGSDLTELSEFMQNCNIPEEEQKRVLQGYMTHNLFHKDKDGNGDDHDDDSLDEDFEGSAAPTAPEATSRLPMFLKKELTTYGHADVLKRRNTEMSKCSPEIIFEIVQGLTSKSMLLPGDFYCKQGEKVPKQLAMIERGTMEVVVNGKCIRILKRGDLLGKEWLLQTDGIETLTSQMALRAHSECTLIVGFWEKEEVDNLHFLHPREFSRLQRKRSKGDIKSIFVKSDSNGSDLPETVVHKNSSRQQKKKRRSWKWRIFRKKAK